MSDMDYDSVQGHLRAIADPTATRANEAIDELRARVAELEQRRVYWTCTVGAETFTTQDHEVCDIWAEDYPVRVCVADDPRVAELESERADLRAARDAAWDALERSWAESAQLYDALQLMNERLFVDGVELKSEEIEQIRDVLDRIPNRSEAD